jgi:hypothetical protein
LDENIQLSLNVDSRLNFHLITQSFFKWNLYLERCRIWFNSLSTIKKLVVTGVAMLLTVWILQTVFALVASVISLAVLAGLVYLGYKFFVADKKGK